MPQYRFVLTTADDRSERTELVGVFNDEGALQYARRLSHSRTIEIWHGDRLVGRVEPAAANPASEPASALG